MILFFAYLVPFVVNHSIFISSTSYSIRDFYHVKSRYLFVYLCIFRVLLNYIVRQLYF